MTLIIMTLGIMTLGIMTLGIMTLGIMTLGMMTLSITVTKCNSHQNIMYNVTIKPEPTQVDNLSIR
jgi:hypothetical protein